jgi:hypothetical protein
VQFPPLADQAHPLLRRAYAQVATHTQASRGDAYLQAAARILGALADILGAPREFVQTVAIAGLVVDELFEQTTTIAEVEAFAARLERLADMSEAQAYLGAIERQPEPWPLADAACIPIAFQTLGAVALAQPLAGEWLAQWRSALTANVRHEANLQRLRLSDGAWLAPPADRRAFEHAVADYLLHFSATQALVVTLVGIFPSVSRPTGTLLEHYAPLVKMIEPLFRFSTDLRVNLEESTNSGIFVTARTQGIALSEARRSLQHDAAIGRLEERLLAHWDELAIVTRERVAQHLAQPGAQAEDERLRALAETLLKTCAMYRNMPGSARGVE